MRQNPRQPKPAVEHVASRLAQCQRRSIDLTLVSLSLDPPLPDSDHHGRQAVFETLYGVCRANAASLFRVGPDRFLVIFSGELPDQARRIGEDLRAAIADLELRTPSGPVTASIGLCSGPAHSKSGPQQFLDCADAQRQIARERGGNRVEAWQQ